VVGLEEDLLRDLSFAIGEGFAGKVALGQRPQELRSAYLDPTIESEVLRSKGVRALYGVPLIHGERLIGVAHMGSVSAQEFSSDDRHLFDSMAARATIGIFQHLLRDELVRSETALHSIAAERTRTLAKLESLLAGSPIGIAFLDRELRYLQINDALAAIHGRPATEHIGHAIAEVIPAWAPVLEPILRRVLETGAPIVNLELPDHLGSTPGRHRLFLATFFPVPAPTGLLTGVGSIIVEMTELRDAQQALRASEARLQSILEHSPMAIFVLDEDRRVVLANRQTLALLRHPGEQIIGRHAAELLPPELEAEQRAIDQRVLRDNHPVTAELAVGSPEGPRTFLWVEFPIPGDGGRLVGGIATEITERKRIEEQLRTESRAREEVLAIVSHDLRNPLGTVQLSATMLLTELATDARARKHLEMIHRATTSMEHLIDDLLDTASIHAGKLALDMKRESVEAVVAEARDLQEPLALEAQVELRLACQVRDVDVICDRDRVLQVFGNLIGNAFKFCRPGNTVTLACERLGEHMRFSVADTGPGVDPRLVPQLFQPYWSTPQGRRRGTGLGLYIAKGIVERHGGRIWFETQPGDGTTVFFTLPIAPEA
jgi:PAS domain S-box-containing protein